MLIKPGNQIKIKVLKNKSEGEASIVSSGNSGSCLVIVSELSLSPGDEVELEVPQREEALCIIRASVVEAGPDREYTVQLQGEPQHLQRRRSERIPANHRAEYILLSNKDKHDFHEGLILNISRNGALLAVKEPLQLSNELFLIFDIKLHTLPGERVVPTGIGGKVVREHFPLEEGSGEWGYNYGVEFEKPFSALTG